jgi:hypothetical protein
VTARQRERHRLADGELANFHDGFMDDRAGGGDGGVTAELLPTLA